MSYNHFSDINVGMTATYLQCSIQVCFSAMVYISAAAELFFLLWPWNITYDLDLELNLDNVKMNQHADYLC